MSKLDSLFFDDPPVLADGQTSDSAPTSSPASTSPTPAPILPGPDNGAADLSAFFLFAPSAPTSPRTRVIDPVPTGKQWPNIGAGIPYGSYHDEAWSETIEIDPSTITPCPKCSGLEFWVSAADATIEICMRCQPPKIQRFRNWMNRREMLLNIHQRQREEDERQQRARADGRDEFGDDAGYPDGLDPAE